MTKETLPTGEMAQTSDDFEAIYETNAPRIYNFMFWRTQDPALAEDLTSHVFEKAWRARASYAGGSVKAWLYRIARNTLIDHWRKPKDLIVDDIEALQVQSDEADPASALDRDILRTDLQAALNRLPADMRSVVELRFMEGLSCRQAAGRLKLTEANVRVIQYRALRKLRGYLQ